MNSKIMLFSLLVSALMLVSINANMLESNDIQAPANSASLDLGSFGGNIAEFAIGNIVVYLIITGIVYFFARSICRSFGRA